MPNDTIIAPRVPLVDPRTGMVAREWYRFFYALANLVLVDNTTSIADLQVGPPSEDQLAATMVEVAKAIQALRVTPPTLDTLPLTKALQGLQSGPPVEALSARVDALTKGLQGLQVAPPTTSLGPLVLTAVATLNFPNTAAGACSDLTMTVTGAVSGDVVTLGVPNGSVPANGVFFAWVSAADTVTVRYANNDPAIAYDPASGDFRAVVSRY